MPSQRTRDARVARRRLGHGQAHARRAEALIEAEPDIFVPVKGAWGRRGSTNVRLEAADEATLRSALAAAWCGVAPKGLAGQLERDGRALILRRARPQP